MDQSEPSGEPQSSSAVVPSVVAVVVTRDPGRWFEEALGSLVDQDYRNLKILVVDAHSAVDPTDRIAEIAPGAFVRRLDTNPGYGAAANHALRMVEGAAFLLLCHDDVTLDPQAVQLMVEEAYRSNAGVVGPKVAMWSEPERLLSVGQGADQFGVPAAIAERGELDQEQHDGVRDVFAVPGGCVLIRADLFGALGGFDEAMTFQGEDVDLCWRAHLAGARVLVAPSARVRHLEAMGARRLDDRRKLQARHRLRMVLGNYGGFYTAVILPRHVVLTLIEVMVATVTGRFRHARDLLGAYAWNLRSMPSLWAKRRQVRRSRRVRDLEIRRLQVRGSARFGAFVRGQLAGTRTQSSGQLAESGRHLVSAVRSGFGQHNVAVVLAVAVVLLFGSRHLLTQRIPVVGELVPFPGTARDLVGEWWSGWRPAGLGVEATPPTGLALFGLAGMAALGATGVVRALLIVGMLPVGILGAWRLGRVVGPSRAPAAAVVAYAANPLPYAAFATGSWRGLAAWAASPWILRRLAEASGARPFPSTVAADEASGGGQARFARQAAGLGLVIALLGVFHPAAPLLALLVVAGMVAGSALVARWSGTVRLALVGLAGAATAVALHGPWLIGGLDNDDPDLSLAGRVSQLGGYSLGEALRFDGGSGGASPLAWGLFVAALLPLAIGRSWRLAWAVRCWGVAAACWALVAADRADLIGFDLPPPGVLLAPAAAALALAVALGMAAFEVDLPGYRFGWRQLASLAAAGALVVAFLPVLAGSFDGRWQMPRGGYDRTLRSQGLEVAERGPFRVLWLGEPAVLPVAGWPLPATVGRGLYATTEGLPATANLWTGPESEAARLVPAALAAARAGETSRLGQQLAPMGIRYVIVADQLAPAPFGGRNVPADPALDDLLAGQLDLEEVDLNPALRVFRNAAWMPLAVDLGSQSAAEAAEALDPVAVGAPLRPDGVNRFAGPVGGGSAVHLGEAASTNWRLEVDGEPAERRSSFGWANRFPTGPGGEAEVRYAVPGRRVALALAQVAVWILVVLVAVRRPSHVAAAGGPRSPGPRWRRRRGAPVSDAGPVLVAPVVAARPSSRPTTGGDDAAGHGGGAGGGDGAGGGGDGSGGGGARIASQLSDGGGRRRRGDGPLTGSGRTGGVAP